MRALPVGAAPALTSTAWNPHVPMVIGVNLLALVGDKTPSGFRFTAQGSANWQIDDVYSTQVPLRRSPGWRARLDRARRAGPA